PSPGRFACLFRDVTEQRREAEATRLDAARLESLLSLSERHFTDVPQILDYALSEALRLTGSRHGYLYHFDEQRHQFTLTAWSRDVLPECRMPGTRVVTDLEHAGIWAEVVRTRAPVLINDFGEPNALKKGCPAGHVTISNFLCVPTFSGDSIVAVVGVANKPGPFDAADARVLRLLMEPVWRVVERTRSETRRRADQERVDFILAATGTRMSVIDAAYGLLYVNEGTHGSREEGRGFTCYSRFFERETPCEGCPAPRAFATGRQTAGEVASPDGSRWFHVVAIPRQEADRTWRVSEISVDITPRKRAETERAQLEEQLRQSQKMESVGLLAGGMAHDINNMLSPILGYSELLLERLPPAEAPADWVRQVMRAAEQVKRLTQALLAFGRRQVLRLEPLDPSSLVRSFEKLISHTVRGDIVVRLTTQGTGRVLADAGQLEQVLMNLAVNAQDAMPHGGVLRLDVSDAELDAAYAEGHPGVTPGPYVAITVTDTGEGIPPEIRERIFEPFFTTKAKGRGTGLGLSTVHGIVSQHKGHIAVTSAPGSGTAFTILLPRVTPSAVERPAAAESPVPRGRGEAILVVEDMENVREIAKRMLDRLGYRTIGAANAADAERLCADPSVSFDLLLTDVLMPGLNGRELYEKMRGSRPKLRVVYMSGYAENMIVHDGALEKGIAYLQKPFTTAELARRIRSALDA
ncbi:MAG TPA: GAF domain-containing protein, partial [Spirochaetia bacterium]|nr:GAF domain-containing protein [Spirochaetia bacterium]